MRERHPTRKSGESRKVQADKARDTLVVGRDPLPPRGGKNRRVLIAGPAPLPPRSSKGGVWTGANFSMPATEAKNRFGEVLKAVSSGGAVFIERHGRNQAVVLDIKVYESLLAKRRTPDEQRLEALRKEFDELYARMQTREAREATDRLSRIADEELDRVIAPRG